MRRIAAKNTACYDASRAMPGRRPSFAADFPASSELDALVDAFERGDYARVRRDATELEKASTDEAVRAAARTLVERTKPDPLAVKMVLLTAGLLVLLAGWWIVHGKAPITAPQTVPTTERVR
jgi:hypothetical protein